MRYLLVCIIALSIITTACESVKVGPQGSDGKSGSEGPEGPMGPMGPMGPAGEPGISDRDMVPRWVLRDKDGAPVSAFVSPYLSRAIRVSNLWDSIPLGQEELLSNADCFVFNLDDHSARRNYYSLKTGRMVDCFQETSFDDLSGMIYAEPDCTIAVKRFALTQQFYNIQGKMHGIYGNSDYVGFTQYWIRDYKDDGSGEYDCVEKNYEEKYEFWKIRELPTEFTEKYADLAPLTIGIEY